MPDEQHRRARRKEAAVLSFLQMEAAGAVNRTDASIEHAKKAIRGGACDLLETASHYDGARLEAGESRAPKFSPRTLRRWLSAYEDLGISGLFDGMGTQGNRDRRLCPVTRSLLAQCVRGYMTREKKSQAAIFMDVKRAFDSENAERRALGRPELVRPSKETVRQAILALDPYHCDVKREGAERARRKHAPIGTGLDLTRPLQRVELDTWKVDLVTLLTDSGLLQFLSEEEKHQLGLTGSRKRWWLTVAMCATTRCILAMRLSRNPSGQATLQTLDMMTQDKGVWSDAVGALSPWHMRGHTPYVYTDCGSEYVSYDVRVAAEDLGINLEHAPGGHPEMRGRVERFFRTMSTHLMERLTGRTFSNMIERGDYDAKARAALTVDDLCQVLIRWVVDIYHRMPHQGLDGETPASCWDRLSEDYGVAPAPDLRRRRLAFGTCMTRTVGEDGITVLGIRYHCEALARSVLRRRNRDVKLRWYNEDLGAIAVQIDGEWIEVPSVMRRFDGVRAQTHVMARRHLQSRFKRDAVLQESVVFQTIADLEAVNGDAMRRVGLLADDWSVERLRRDEDKLFVGFKIQPDNVASERNGFEPGFGRDLSTAISFSDDDVNVPLANKEDYVSVASASNEFPGRAERLTQADDDEDDPDFEFEGKR